MIWLDISLWVFVIILLVVVGAFYVGYRTQEYYAKRYPFVSPPPEPRKMYEPPLIKWEGGNRRVSQCVVVSSSDAFQ